MHQDPRIIAKEFERRERRAWVYISVVAVLFGLGTFGFLWWSW